MKYLMILLLLLLLGSCTKEEEPGLPVPLYGPCEDGLWAEFEMGWMSALKNGEAMQGSSTSGGCHLAETQMTIFFYACDSLDVLSELFLLGCFPQELKRYDLCQSATSGCDSHSASYYTTYDDQPEDYYLLDESKESYLEITAIDTVEGWVEGRFDLWFVHDKKRKPKEYEANPDRVRFSEGRFRALRQ